MKTTDIIKANKLMPGDCIGIAAPSSPFIKEDFFKGIDILESMGFFVMFPDGLFNRKGYLAGSDFPKILIDLVNDLAARVVELEALHP